MRTADSLLPSLDIRVLGGGIDSGTRSLCQVVMGKKSNRPRADFDGAWKQVLDRYLDPWLRLCFPIVHAGIDWSRGFAALDQELQEVVRDVRTGKRRVDTLYRVFRLQVAGVPRRAA